MERMSILEGDVPAELAMALLYFSCMDVSNSTFEYGIFTVIVTDEIIKSQLYELSPELYTTRMLTLLKVTQWNLVSTGTVWRVHRLSLREKPAWHCQAHSE